VKKEITQEEFYKVAGLHTLWREYYKKWCDVEKVLLQLLEAQEDGDECYGGIASDLLWDDLTPSEYLHRCGIIIKKSAGHIENKR